MKLAEEVRPSPAGSPGQSRHGAVGGLSPLLGLAAVSAIGVYLFVALRRAGYPYQVEWLEGGAVEHVRRVLEGRTLYPAPSAGFVPYPYPPLYFWVSAGVSLVTGAGLLALRLVSIGASLASMGLLYLLVRHEGGARLHGLVAAGLFAAGFRLSGGFYDVARVDSLMVALLLGSLLLAARARRPSGFAAAGVVLGLAVLTKQPALIAGAPVAAWLLARRGVRNGLLFVAGAVVPVVAVALVLQVVSSGWFGKSVVGVPLGHGVDPTWWLGFWTHDLAPHLWPAALMVLLVVVWRRPGWGLHLSAAGGLVAASYASRLHSASAENVLMPVVAAAALLAGLALAQLPGRAVLVGGLALVQFVLLAYNPAAQIPPAGQTAAAVRLRAVLRSIPGEVLVVAHPWETTVAGKGDHAEAGAIQDFVRSSDLPARAALQRSLAEAVAAQRFSVLAFDNEQDYAGFPPDLSRWYQRVDPPPGLGPPASPSLDTPFVGHPTEWWVARRLNRGTLWP